MELRPYQEEARQAIHQKWDDGDRKTLLVIPTGGGKTIIFSQVIDDQVRKGERVLVLAHRGELLDQAADKLERSTGLKCAREQAEDTSLGSWFRVVVGSVQTMMRDKRLSKFKSDHFGTIIVDEAHHVLSSSYQRVLDHFDEAQVLGVTATPDRGDMRNLGQFFDSLAYEYTLPRAIKEGYLSPIKALTIPIKLDLTGAKTQAGDYRAADIGHALDPYLEAIADEMLTHCKGRKTVVFLPLIDTSQRFTKMLQDRGFRAAEVNGESKDRAEILAGFDQGEYDVLCNSMLLTEGWDCPSVDCVVVLRPTKVRSLYSQMVGRGTRLHPGKDHLLLLDFLWHTERHELCRPAHLIASSPEVADKMIEMAADEDAEELTLFDLEELEAAAESSVLEEREQALADRLKELRGGKKNLVDPLQFEMSIQDEDLAGYMPSFGWEMAPASDKQLKAIAKYGIEPGMIDNAGKAGLILDRLQKRKEAGLATPKQIRLLERRKFKNVGMWSFEAASKMIDRMAGNSWRVPQGINPATYVPDAPAETAKTALDWIEV